MDRETTCIARALLVVVFHRSPERKHQEGRNRDEGEQTRYGQTVDNHRYYLACLARRPPLGRAPQGWSEQASGVIPGSLTSSDGAHSPAREFHKYFSKYRVCDDLYQKGRW